VFKLRFIIPVLFIIPSLALAQDVLPAAGQVTIRSRFLADSLRIGEKVPFSVTATYPRKLNILYPDSSYSFNPFEFESKQFFPTKTKDSVSYDSVVYFISSYEIDSIQTFRMPVYVLQGSDCTAVFGATDSIFLKQMVAHVPDSVNAEQLPLKINTKYLNVNWLFNYPIAIYVGIALVVIAIVVWFVFGKRIRRYFVLKRLNKDHVDFLQRYADAMQQMETEYSSNKAERALVIWKKYMESLEQKPFSKYTSKEILRLLNDNNLSGALKAIDKMVYGGLVSDTSVFQELREVSRSHYNEKLRQLNNG
jgi:hypothetical protein